MSFPRRFATGTFVLSLIPSGILGQEATEPGSQSARVLSLPQAVALALDHHPAIGEARARLDVAAGVLRQAGAARFPSVSSDASLARYQEPSIVAPLHGFDPTMAPAFDKNLVRGNLTVAYSIYDGGARGARIAQAESGEGMAVAGQASSALTITAQTTAAFLEILSTAELLEAAGSQTGGSGGREGAGRPIPRGGKGGPVELLRVQAALGQAEATEISFESRLGVVQGRLARLTGLPAEDVRRIDLAPVQVRPASPGGLPEVLAKARSASPELELARHQVASAAAGVQVAKASMYPSVQAAGAYSEFGSLNGGHTLEWQGSLRVSFPLFHRRSQERKPGASLRGGEVCSGEAPIGRIWR